MKRYSDYKDSGVAWIGKIPSHWQVNKIKRCVDILTCGVASTPEYTTEEEGVLFLSAQNVSKDGYLNLEKKAFITKELHNKLSKNRKVRKGDILQVRVGGKSNIGQTCILDIDVESSVYVSLTHIRTNDIILNKYMKYYLQQEKFKDLALIDSEKTVGQSNLNVSDMRQYTILVPPKEEQNKIAKYLDEKTLQIETLIRKKYELIKTLKLSRTKLISKTVTKGLDKNVPMKDSGVEWIGDIPSHYNVKKLRYLGTLQNGISKGAEEFGFGYPFVSYGDVYKNINISNKVEGLVNSSKEDRRIYSVIEGDVFFTRTSETIEEIGFASTCLNTIQDATFAGFLIRFRPNTNELYKGYSKYYFRSNIHRKFFVKEMNLVTRASLGQNLLKNLPVVIPSYEEQIEISNYLDKQVTIVDNSIIKIQEQIEVLKKAKQKLITEVVTGKIDVTNL